MQPIKMGQPYSRAISRLRLLKYISHEHHFQDISLTYMTELGGTRKTGPSRSCLRPALKLEIFFKSSMVKGLLLDQGRPSFLQQALR